MTLDVYFEQEGKGSHVNLQQSEEGYQVLLILIGRDRVCVMEATGNYLNLAHYLPGGYSCCVRKPFEDKTVFTNSPAKNGNR